MNGADFLKTQSCTCAGMVMLKFIFIIGFHWSIYFATGRTLFKALVLNFHPFTVELSLALPCSAFIEIPRQFLLQQFCHIIAEALYFVLLMGVVPDGFLSGAKQELVAVCFFPELAQHTIPLSMNGQIKHPGKGKEPGCPRSAGRTLAPGTGA